MPDYLHPLSYHSSFGYNTNIWLTRRTSVNATGTATAAPVGFDLASEWYLPGNQGTGRRPCDWFSVAQRLGNRCRCPKGWKCGQAAKALEAAAKLGKLAPKPMEPVEVTQFSVQAW